MKCRRCSCKAVYRKDKYLCREHFIEWFEKKVKDTIKKFSLIKSSDDIVVACSGGKDSTTILDILRRSYDSVQALTINEGTEYRKKTIGALKRYCMEHSVELKIYSFSEEFGFGLDDIKENRMCMKCGTLRRYLLNLKSKSYDKVVTGHNLDDEAQNILMNLCKSNLHAIERSGPRSGQEDQDGFVPRVKPLYFCSEKEITIYSFLKGFYNEFPRCPYSHTSFRNDIREQLDLYEMKNPGSKERLVKNFLDINMETEEKIKKCSICGEPSGRDICKACKILKRIRTGFPNQ